MSELLYGRYERRTVQQFAIGARSAHDHVLIGPYDTRELAEQDCRESGWPTSLVFQMTGEKLYDTETNEWVQ